jgi:ABC-type polysaccharide/polyol phosphate transport system ATPase subunit
MTPANSLKDALLQLIRGGVSAIFVSHNLTTVKEICHRTIWLDEGRITPEAEHFNQFQNP